MVIVVDAGATWRGSCGQRGLYEASETDLGLSLQLFRYSLRINDEYLNCTIERVMTRL